MRIFYFIFLVQQALFQSVVTGRLALQRPSISKTGQFLKDYFTPLDFALEKCTAECNGNDSDGLHSGGLSSRLALTHCGKYTLYTHSAL